jgi:tripartite-type tricarboxylate transporter receptor subunit TctC
MHTDRRRLLTGALAFGAACATPVRAQDAYPNRPVHVIVPYSLDGNTGIFARMVTGAMTRMLGQPFIVEHRPGDAAIGAAEAVAHAAPDGYTVLIGDVSTYAVNKSLYRDLPYDPQKDFAPITLTGRLALVLLVNTNRISVNSLGELIEMARRAPGTIDYASPGVGTPSHLTTELFADAAGVKLRHVPCHGDAAAFQGLASAQAGMMFIDFVNARSDLTAPGIKALAIASPEDYPALPGVPTVAASGFPGFEAWMWQGLAAPAGTDTSIIEKLRTSYVEIIKAQQMIHSLAGAGFDILQSTPAEFADYMRSESGKWRKVIRTADIRAD